MQRILTLLALVALFALMANGCSDSSTTNPGTTDEDLTPPAAPVSLSVQAKDNVVTVAWMENSEADLDEYNVYCSTNNSDYQLAGTIDHARFEISVSGDGYFHMSYRVSALDNSGNESALSAPAEATVDTSQPQTAMVDLPLEDQRQ